MKGLKIISLFICTGFLFAAFAGEVTVVLQNGLNEYEGCADAYVSSSSSSNYGTSTKLECKYDVCVS